MVCGNKDPRSIEEPQTDYHSCRKVACVLSELNIPYQTIFVDFSKVGGVSFFNLSHKLTAVHRVITKTPNS